MIHPILSYPIPCFILFYYCIQFFVAIKKNWHAFFINRSCLDENEAFLTTADSAVKLLPKATKPVAGWKGIEYRAAFPMLKPPGANFYPPDMDKMVLKCEVPLVFKLNCFKSNKDHHLFLYRNLKCGRAV